MSLAKITEAFRAEGVHLTERLDEGDHFHVAWGAKGGKGPSDETLAKRQQAAEDKGTRDAEAYAQQMSRAQEETLKLQRDQVISRSAAAELDVAAVQTERQRLDSAAQAGAAERKWSQAQADALIAQNAINAGLKTEAIQRVAMSQTIQAMFADSQDARDARDALLQIDLDMADTRKERLATERQLLADRQQSRYEGFDKIAQDENASPEDRAKAEGAMAKLPAQNAAESRQLETRYQAPLGAFRDQLRGSVGDMGDALQGVAVDGLKGVESGLQGIADKTKTVSQAFRSMAVSVLEDLEKIALEKGLLAIFGLKDGGEVGGGILHLATGGPVFGAGGPRDDKVPAMLSHGEFVINSAAYAQHPQLVQAINSGALPAFADGGLVGQGGIFFRPVPDAASISRPPQIIMVHATTDVSPYFDTRVVATTAPMAQAAMAGGAAQARQDAADDLYASIP